MTKKQKKMVVRLLLSGVCFAFALLVEDKYSWSWVPFIISYLLAGYDIPLKAARNLTKGQLFDETFLMTIATFGAIIVGSLEEAVAVMLFYQVGELFSDYAVNRSRRSITELMDINPEYANLLKDGEEKQITFLILLTGWQTVLRFVRNCTYFLSINDSPRNKGGIPVFA